MLPEDSQKRLKQLPVLRKGVDLTKQSRLSNKQSLTWLPCAHVAGLAAALRTATTARPSSEDCQWRCHLEWSGWMLEEK